MFPALSFSVIVYLYSPSDTSPDNGRCFITDNSASSSLPDAVVSLQVSSDELLCSSFTVSFPIPDAESDAVTLMSNPADGIYARFPLTPSAGAVRST